MDKRTGRPAGRGLRLALALLPMTIVVLAACARAAPSPSPLPPSPSTQVPTPKPVGTVIAQGDASMSGMVAVPAGEFTMGSDEDTSEERPAHTVYVDAFWIDRTEVTYGDYVRFLNSLVGHKGRCLGYDCNETKDVDRQSHMLRDEGKYVVESGYEGYPMAELSWYGAQAYCEWIGKRLPTEAEWEKAARGTDARRYPWGSEDPDCTMANFRTCVRHTIDVGSYPKGASPYGALDMAGNVWEWTADWYDGRFYHTPEASEPNPQGPASGIYRVARGGSSYDLDLFLIRTTYRFGNDPKSHHRLVGFRCVQQ